MNLQELGVQSFCFRHFKDNVEVARLVRECGLTQIELCGVHVDFKDESSFDGVIEIYRRHSVDIVSIGVQRMTGDEAAERPFFEFARRAGARTIAVNFPVGNVPQSYRVAERLAEEYDMLLGIHNHGATHWLGNSEMLENVFQNTSARIGLCLDTAWALDSRENPPALAEKFANRLYGVHIKDFIFNRARKPEDVVVGTGNLDLPALVTLLQNNSATRSVVLEYEGDVENPVPALRQCVTAVQSLA